MAPRILHIETSGRLCSVALSAGEELMDSRASGEVNDHSATLAPMIDGILRDSGLKPGDLDAVSVSIGPGSYTGLRVGLSTAKAICFVAGCRLLTVSTLESIAHAAMAMDSGATDYYAAVLDARRMDAYLGVFDRGGSRLDPDRFITIAPGCLHDMLSEGRSVMICGEGTERWQVLLPHDRIRIMPLECHALNLVPLAVKAYGEGRFADVAGSVPFYLKPPNITAPAAGH